MIQKGTMFNVIDNSGAKKACCIHIFGGYRNRYARVGDVILVSIKSLKGREDEKSKINKGDIVKALVIRTKTYKPTYSKEAISFAQNSLVLLNAQNKFLGTRVFGPVQKSFRFTKYLRILSLASGIIK